MSGSSHGEDLGLERVVFLSDGVFAIAMTLLVLDVRLPELPPKLAADAFGDALRDLAPRLFAYGLSFAILAALWVGHWRRFQRIARANGRLAALNLLLLAFVALIPFPTAVMGSHGDQPAAVILYAVTLALAGIMGVGGTAYALRAGLMADGTPTDLRGSGVLRALVMPAVMLGSLLLLPVIGPYGVEWSWVAILPLAILARPSGWSRTEESAPSSGDGPPPVDQPPVDGAPPVGG